MNKITVILLFVFILLVSAGCNNKEQNVVANEEIFNNIPVVKSKAEINQSPGEVNRIRVVAFQNKQGVIYGFTVSGRSNYAEEGKDIFNAAISVLSQNTVNSLKNLTKDRVESEVKDGYVKCIVPDLKEGKSSADSAILLKSMLLGMISIEQNYGDKYIKVERLLD